VDLLPAPKRVPARRITMLTPLLTEAMRATSSVRARAWQIPSLGFGTLLFWLVVYNTIFNIYAGLGLDESPLVFSLAYFAWGVVLSIWYLQECRDHPGRQQFNGLLWLVVWPVAVPMYLVQTQGWKKTLGIVAAVLVATAVGVLLGNLLARLIGWSMI
jgi:hypothetical protein